MSRLRRIGQRFPSTFIHLTDVDDLFDGFTVNDFSSRTDIRQECTSTDCVQTFFTHFNSELFYPCKDQHIFSHCQQHWIAVFDSDTQYIHSYHKTECTLYNI